ncbi:restriction endonuclease [Amycolatopsis sp. NPDC098790]|uniref:restriction endonuclease n=1 Tax=Amycolatopsis sp. NPDC098790 TaxID=3363939 RepID=UPI003827461D
MRNALEEWLDALQKLDDPAKRGRDLEEFAAEMFRQHHFEVTRNPRTARPRQTDVLATRDGEIYLIECKWRSTKADIDDIDSLRSRLRRTERRVVGVLISFEGFTGSVVSDVEQHRSQPVLLISGDELRLAAIGLVPLSELLWRKRDALLTNGTVLLDEPDAKRPKTRHIGLPVANLQFMQSDGKRSQVIECAGEFGQFVFAHELPDIDWVAADGYGVTLDVAPRGLDEYGLLELVGKLAALGWATPDARWSVQQANRNWHGLGSAAFAEQLPRWDQRAKTPGAYDSEEICYLDRCDGGFYTLTANLAADRSRRATMITLSFQLEGIPLDSAPLVHLCRSIGVHEGLYWRPRGDRSVTRSRESRPLVADVRPLAYLVGPAGLVADDPTEWVSGIVIANPFIAEPADAGRAELPDGLALLEESEHLVCALAEHHRLGDLSRYSYYLRSLEYARTSEALVCRPVANWRSEDPPMGSRAGRRGLTR